ncbi:hypothetical protein BC828DRAFT_377841 [Blastocladiella britannica]|nr:hypothetical protein BC828DRAFT_377841 [Blastocladiella britannica]
MPPRRTTPKARGAAEPKRVPQQQQNTRQVATPALSMAAAAKLLAAPPKPKPKTIAPNNASFEVVSPHLEDHCALLRVLASVFGTELAHPDYLERLQRIKQLFYERDFLGIFGDPALVATYSARYISGRALAYLDLVRDVPAIAAALDACRTHPVVSIGGGAGSELAAFGFFWRTRRLGAEGESNDPLQMLSIDIGDFSDVLERLQTALGPPSPTAPEEGQGRVVVSHRFMQADVLQPDALASLAPALTAAPLVTLFFTLNELFVQSRAGALQFVTKLTRTMRPGAILWVCDSAGSFSDIQIGSREYKITVFLDMLPGLERVAGDDARWWRVADGEAAEYPVRIENMRFFYRAYRIKATIRE